MPPMQTYPAAQSVDCVAMVQLVWQVDPPHAKPLHGCVGCTQPPVPLHWPMFVWTFAEHDALPHVVVARGYWHVGDAPSQCELHVVGELAQAARGASGATSLPTTVQ